MLLSSKHIPAMVAAATGVVLAFTLAGCSSQSTDSQTVAQQNRAYMSSVNQTVDEISAELEEFTDAVTDMSVAKMKVAASNVSKLASDLEDIDAPSVMKDVQQNYVDGAEKLAKALQSYVDLYDDLNAGEMDQEAYDEAVQEVQAQYDEGLAALKSADEAVAKLATGSSDSSSSSSSSSTTSTGTTASTSTSSGSSTDSSSK